MTSDRILYISSLGSTNAYTDNIPSSFINNLNIPIQLKPNTDYEIALMNILHPKTYFILDKDDPESAIILEGTRRDDNTGYTEIYKFLPLKNIYTDSRAFRAVNAIIDQLVYDLKAGFKNSFNHYFPGPSNKIMYYGNPDSVFIHYHERPTSTTRTGPYPYKTLTLKFGKRMAILLGFEPNKRYKVYQVNPSLPENSPPVSFPLQSERPPRGDGGVEFIFIYTDLVEPTEFAGQLVNILDACALESARVGRNLSAVVYKKINATIVDKVSIKITDQAGRPVLFDKGDSVTLTLHLRERKY